MNISSNSDVSNPEVEVSGKATEFLALGYELLRGKSDVNLESKGVLDQFYPVGLKALKCTVETASENPGQLRLKVNNLSLLIVGDAKALRNLGQSLINTFTGATADEHMHLEYYEGNQLVAPSECSVIFMCCRPF